MLGGHCNNHCTSIRLCVGTTTCSRQRRRRMKLKPWHMSGGYQRKVNITVMKAMLLWNLQLCTSGVCQHHESVDVDFSPGQSAAPSCFPRKSSAHCHHHLTIKPGQQSPSPYSCAHYTCVTPTPFSDLGCCFASSLTLSCSFSQDRQHL